MGQIGEFLSVEDRLESGKPVANIGPLPIFFEVPQEVGYIATELLYMADDNYHII